MASACIALPARADFNTLDWKYFKEIRGGESGVVQLRLDQESFAGVQKDLRDLRVIAGEGEEIPYTLVIERDKIISDRFSFPLTIFNNAYTLGAYQQFIVDFGAKLKGQEPHNYIKILTQERNFQRQVEISGGDDAQNWQLIKSDGYVYDYTDTRGNLHAQNTTVQYSPSTFRYLRIKIFSEKSFHVNGAQVYRYEQEKAKETAFDAVLTQTNDSQTGYTQLLVDLGQDGLPTHEVTLATRNANFDRPVSISGFGSDPNLSPQQAVGLGSGYIFRYNTSTFRGENLVLSYQETSLRYIQIRIFNGDDAPLEFIGARVRGILRSIVFEAEAPKQYRLYYGNIKARRPVYDIERRFPYIDVSSASSAQLGAQKNNPSFVKVLPPVSERYTFLLPAVLILASAFLMFLVFRFMKKVK